MACHFPLRAFKGDGLTENGKAVLHFRKEDISGPYIGLELPCGQCIGCILDKALDMSLRCCHEASMWTHNVFVTLTYADDCLPKNSSLDKTHWTQFRKKLYKYKGGAEYSKKYGRRPIRFYHCGEYGELCEVCGKHAKYHKGEKHKYQPMLGRPHHHAILFNVEFTDLVLFKEKKTGNWYISEELERIWSYEVSKRKAKYHEAVRPGSTFMGKDSKLYVKRGFCVVGRVNKKTAEYVARYTAKKVGNAGLDSYYCRYDRKTGEGVPVEREYVTCSRRPGLGSDWYDEGGCRDLFPKDFTTWDGKKYRVPVYYWRKLQESTDEKDVKICEQVKRKRLDTILKMTDEERSLARRMARDKIVRHKVKKYERNV